MAIRVKIIKRKVCLCSYARAHVPGLTQTSNTGNNFRLLDKNWTKVQISILTFRNPLCPPNLDAKMAALPVP